MTKYPFYTAATHLYDFYGISLVDADFENIALNAWDKIGNKRVRTYLFKGPTVNGELQLPCNVDIIEAVTSATLDYQMTDNISRENYTASVVESYIEGRKSNQQYLSAIGKYLNYEQVGNTLYFKQNIYGDIHVLYKGLIVDENGLPELTYKEVEAIAKYCAYVDTRKKAMQTKDKATMEIAMFLKAEWERSCDSARTPEFLNQNDFDTILEAKNSWDRKRYNVSYKPAGG